MEMFNQFGFSFIVFVCLIPTGLACYPDDRMALLNFSRQLQPHPWPAANESSSCCLWEGVRCTGNPSIPVSSRRVIALELVYKGLFGTISGSLGRLDQLKFLNLSQNFLYGPIPEALFSARSLRLVLLDGNDLSGKLSPAIGNLSNLAYLNIAHNNLSGPIPDIFHQLRGGLEYFNVWSNNFSGQLPSSLLTSSALRVLVLMENSLTVNTDYDFSRLRNLTMLYIGYNRFSNGIPQSIFSCRKLVGLDLSGINLHGEFPHQFNHLRSLQFLQIGDNNFTNITAALDALSQCSNLNFLELSGSFNGEVIPADGTWEFPSLTALVINRSNLSGSIPFWLSRCTQLVSLSLSRNRLDGTIPAWFGKLKYILRLDLSNNILAGEIPETLAPQGSPAFTVTRNFKLYYYLRTSKLDLSNNLLNGTTWRSLSNLKHLGRLNLSNNFFSGSIPVSLSDMKEIELLDLSSNNISGNIPPSLQKLTFLNEFSVANNHLEGNIPTGGQFLTFPCSSFFGNPMLHLASFPGCNTSIQQHPDHPIFVPHQYLPTTEHRGSSFLDMAFPFGLGVFIGFISICLWMLHFLA